MQGRRVLKDFNIANEAQGVGKELIKEFPAHVSTNDLEIRFYWAGKGTTNIPYRSVYGPLISAISVKYAQYGGLSSKFYFFKTSTLMVLSDSYCSYVIIKQTLQVTCLQELLLQL